MTNSEQDLTEVPEMVTGRDEEGFDVHIDVGLLLAHDPKLRALVHTALELFFRNEGVTDHPVGFAITVFDRTGRSGTALTTDWNKDIDLENYSPEEADIIERRQ